MQKDGIVIVIVDDDATFGNSLKEGVARAGYKAHVFKKPDEALSFSKLNLVNGFIIDCMLPKMNGIDLAIKFKETASENDLFLLMSGIYRDKNFAKSAIKKTGAQDFLFKPFVIQDLVTTIDQHFQSAAVPETANHSPLYEMMAIDQISSRQKIKAINGSENVHGFDLPWIFSLLMDEKISGHLTIVLPHGEVAGVGFHDGCVVNVNLKDSQSYFGALLIEKGFITSEEFDIGLKDTTSTKRVGEKLVDANFLSPHAIDIVITEQLGIRLSKLVADHSVTVNFNKSNEIQTEARFDTSALSELMDVWIGTKFNLEWLKALYIPFSQFQLKKGPAYSLSHRALSLPVLAKVSEFLSDLIKGVTIETLAASGKYKDSVLYPALHTVLLHRIVVFDLETKSLDLTARKKRLLQLEQELEHKTFFERLNLSQNARENEIKRAYHDLAKALHPDTLDSQTPQDMKDLTKRVFDKIQLAYDTLKNKPARDLYLKELELGKAEFVLKADTLTEKGRSHLKVGDWAQAYGCFAEAAKLCPPSSDLRMLLLWTEAKSGETKKLSATQIGDFHRRLKEVPPEDRHNATYYLVRGIIQKLEGRIDDAFKSFKQSLHIDQTFIYARRELSMSKESIDKSQKVDIFKSDLKDVVGMLFKRKK